VISKNFFLSIFWAIQDFLSEKTRFLGKKNPSLCRLSSAICRDFMDAKMKILSARFLKDAFKLDTSPWG
jgi:hypothetical protein